jgi:hypothetical protein
LELAGGLCPARFFFGGIRARHASCYHSPATLSSAEREVSEYIPLYKELLAAGIDFVIIGGQACNIWALLQDAVEPDLKQYKPYTSIDLDLYSRSQTDVTRAARQLHVEAILADSGSPAPVMGYVLVDAHATQILIQFLNGSAGIVKSQEIYDSRQTIELAAGLRLQVMHPIHVLQSKLALVGTRGYKVQQDLKHLKMALLFLRAFISDTSYRDQREAIRLCKRIVRQAGSSDGIRAFHRFEIKVEEAIPTLTDPSALPKLARFLYDTLPSLIEKVNTKRLNGRKSPE